MRTNLVLITIIGLISIIHLKENNNNDNDNNCIENKSINKK